MPRLGPPHRTAELRTRKIRGHQCPSTNGLSAQDALLHRARGLALPHARRRRDALRRSAGAQHADGGLDIDRIRAAIEARLHLVPRFRQRLAYLPYERLPIWVDDDRFRLAYHVRHTALPKPGDERMLKRLVGRIMSQQLDRTRPLWEMWFVEGLENDQFALISKTHHCMIDGVSGADLISVIMEPFPNPEPGEPLSWTPRPHPSDARLLFDEVRRRMRAAARRACGRPAPPSAIPSRPSPRWRRASRRSPKRSRRRLQPGLAAADQHRGAARRAASTGPRCRWPISRR